MCRVCARSKTYQTIHGSPELHARKRRVQGDATRRGGFLFFGPPPSLEFFCTTLQGLEINPRRNFEVSSMKSHHAIYRLSQSISLDDSNSLTPLPVFPAAATDFSPPPLPPTIPLTIQMLTPASPPTPPCQQTLRWR